MAAKALLVDAVHDHVQNSNPVVRIPALLRGPDGTLAQCIIESWKELSSTGKTYVRCRIIDDPPELPNGQYRIEFAERSLRANKHYGKWDLMFLAPIETAPTATDAA